MNFIDPVTGEAHRNDHICNQQCLRLKAEAVRKERELKDRLQKALTSLRNPSHLIMESRESVIVYKDDLKLILDRLDELEGRVSTEPDLESELEVGDTVFTLIRYMEIEPGTKGKVVAVTKKAVYPIEVHFENINSPYIPEGLIAFNRGELGKVHK